MIDSLTPVKIDYDGTYNLTYDAPLTITFDIPNDKQIIGVVGYITGNTLAIPTTINIDTANNKVYMSLVSYNSNTLSPFVTPCIFVLLK